MKGKRAVLLIKDYQIMISHLDKGEKGKNLAQEFGISKQQEELWTSQCNQATSL